MFTVIVQSRFVPQFACHLGAHDEHFQLMSMHVEGAHSCNSHDTCRCGVADLFEHIAITSAGENTLPLTAVHDSQMFHATVA